MRGDNNRLEWTRGPVSSQEKRFSDYPVDCFFGVITMGAEAMHRYSNRIPESGGRGIIARIRALHLSPTRLTTTCLRFDAAIGRTSGL